MMANKVVNLIGSETANTFVLSNNITRKSFCSSNRRRKCSCFGLSNKYSRCSSLVLHVQASFEPGSDKPDTSFKDNVKYLLKLGVGSVVGAALIKYGSAAVPAITKPDIYVALLMISTPPLIAVLLLAQESRKN